MKMTMLILGLMGCSAVYSCRPSLPPEPPYVVYPPFDGGVIDAEVEVSATCRLYCESLAKIGCPEAGRFGRSCGSMCTVAESNGMDLRTLCVANASTGDQVRSCCADGEPCSPTRCRGR